MPGSNPCPLCLIFGFIIRPKNSDKFRLSQKQSFQVPLQTRYSLRDIEYMQRDCKYVYNLLKEKPKETLKILRSITKLRLDKVARITRELNLFESKSHQEIARMIVLLAVILISE